MGFNVCKTVLRIVTGAGLIVTLSSYVLLFADNPSKDNYWAEMAERFKRELSLTEEQTAKIQTILENMVTPSSENAAALPQETSSLHEVQRIVSGHKIRDKIYLVLTDEQRKKYEQLQASKNEADE